MTEERDPLTHAVIGAAIEVHREWGPGLLELPYQKSMELELKWREIPFVAQLRLPLIYKGVSLEEDYVLDLFVQKQLVVELKAVEKLLPIHEAQLLTYMRLMKAPVGLLINFNLSVLKDGIKRMVL
ncbi:MAG: GxxExxY protein [Planctomycetales bacterium]|nr:GxxExxY protein [Planctomycetales bacterium]